ncbi:hypothetical protein H9Q13_05270 [Pontibacter sp. JH31]|uniref:Uncharacterized protein n=1 Tax=Pontibacter aquaedesilientis TaxID=2766980 RepID=A0ABR7XG36_9BACT|nr:hypothetical protein [Pontibacter aquaedesilientis]MBD1396568.1 hypothetical protein [Pontibacter aquaedesilientis]
MRTIYEIEKDIDKAQADFDSFIMKIGLLHYPWHDSPKTKEDKLESLVENARESERRLQEYISELTHTRKARRL